MVYVYIIIIHTHSILHLHFLYKIEIIIFQREKYNKHNITDTLVYINITQYNTMNVLEPISTSYNPIKILSPTTMKYKNWFIDTVNIDTPYGKNARIEIDDRKYKSTMMPIFLSKTTLIFNVYEEFDAFHIIFQEACNRSGFRIISNPYYKDKDYVTGVKQINLSSSFDPYYHDTLHFAIKGEKKVYKANITYYKGERNGILTDSNVKGKTNNWVVSFHFMGGSSHAANDIFENIRQLITRWDKHAIVYDYYIPKPCIPSPDAKYFDEIAEKTYATPKHSPITKTSTNKTKSPLIRSSILDMKTHPLIGAMSTYKHSLMDSLITDMTICNTPGRKILPPLTPKQKKE